MLGAISRVCRFGQHLQHLGQKNATKTRKHETRKKTADDLPLWRIISPSRDSFSAVRACPLGIDPRGPPLGCPGRRGPPRCPSHPDAASGRTRVERFDRRGIEPFEPFEPFEFFQNRNFPEFPLENSKISENFNIS